MVGIIQQWQSLLLNRFASVLAALKCDTKKTLNIRTIHFWWVNFTVKYKLLWISDTEINQYLKCHRLETFSFSFELPIDACFTVKNLINVSGFPGLCSCCPIKPLSSHHLLPTSDTGATVSQTSPVGSDQRQSSVAELRRKAQEHSAALLQSLQHVANFQHAAGLNFPLLPPLTLQALQRKHEMGMHSSPDGILAKAPSPT